MEGLGYFGVGALAGAAGGAIGGAGLGMMQTAALAGAAGGAITGGGNAFVAGGSGIDIMKGTIGGTTFGAGGAIAATGALIGLGAVGSNIDCWGMGPLSTGSEMAMYPTLTNVFQHYTHDVSNFISSNLKTISGMGAGNLFDYFVARNGTHLRVDQYMNYISQRDNGTSPQWMLNNLSSWEKNIQIPFTNMDYYPSGIELSTLGSRNLYLGDYKRYGGNYEFSGGSMGTYNLKFDDIRSLSFGFDSGVNSDGSPYLGTVFDDPRGSIPNRVKNISFSANGTLPNVYQRGINISGGLLKIIVRHASHL